MTQKLFGDFRGYATAAFGMEGLVSEELKRFGMKDVFAENGGVRFTTGQEGIIRCNLLSRYSDRIFIVLSEGDCLSFEELFQLVLRIPWEKYAEGTEAINISCRCSRSQLMSERDCQSITKKAVIERLKASSGLRVFPENGPALPVMVSVRNNHIRIMLSTSGEALSRRGYRTWNGQAPLRETLAAALVRLSPWRPGMPLHDPCCGTGTIVIEAAFQAMCRAPGLRRSFAMESFCWTDTELFAQIRKNLEDEVLPSPGSSLSGSDSDPEALALSRRHISQAGLIGHMEVFQTSLQELQLEEENGVFICNPPYGERLESQASCRKLYRDLHEMKDRHSGWALCAITSDPAFERYYGKRASRKRRLYNGTLECTYYIYE